MNLNTLKPAPGSKTPQKRLGRGIGSGKGKTCGRGHKGQRARAGGYHKLGFEGGQMPLQRRVPKFGFRSQAALSHEEIRLSDLNQVKEKIVDLAALKAANVIRNNTKTVKVIATGTINHAITLKGIAATKGAIDAIKAAGGQVEVQS